MPGQDEQTIADRARAVEAARAGAASAEDLTAAQLQEERELEERAAELERLRLEDLEQRQADDAARNTRLDELAKRDAAGALTAEEAAELRALTEAGAIVAGEHVDAAKVAEVEEKLRRGLEDETAARAARKAGALGRLSRRVEATIAELRRYDARQAGYGVLEELAGKTQAGRMAFLEAQVGDLRSVLAAVRFELEQDVTVEDLEAMGR